MSSPVVVTSSLEATPTIIEDCTVVPVPQAPQDALASIGVSEISELLEEW